MPLLLKKLTRPLFQYRLPVSGKVAIGRDKTKNDLIVDEPSVSRIHGELEVSPNSQITLKDLGSSIGTIVGEKKLEKNKAVHVSIGEHLRFGIAEFTLVDVPIVICTSGLSVTEKEKISRLAKQMGIKIRNELDASVTHVIIMPNGWTVTSKLLLGLLAQKEIVTPAWIVAMHDNPLLGIPDCDKYRPGPLSERHLTELGTVISMTQSEVVNVESTAGGVQPDFHIRKDRLELFAGIPTFIIPAFAEAKVSDEKELLRRGGARKFVLSSDPARSSLPMNIDQQTVLVCPSPVAVFRQSNPSLAYLPAVDKSHIILSVLLGIKLVPFPPEEGAKPPLIVNQARMSPVTVDRSFRLPPMSSSRASNAKNRKESSPVTAQSRQPIVVAKPAEDINNPSSKDSSLPVAEVQSIVGKDNESKKVIVPGGNQLETNLFFNNNAKPKVPSPTNESSNNNNSVARFSTPQHSSVGSPLPPPIGSSVASSVASSKQSESESALAPPQSSGPRIRMDFDVQALVHERPPVINALPPCFKQKITSPVIQLLSGQQPKTNGVDGGVKAQAGAKSKLPTSLVKPQPPPQQQKKKKEAFDLPADNIEDDIEERILTSVLGGYDKVTVGGGSEKQEYIPPKDTGWLEKPHIPEGNSITTNTMSDIVMVEGSEQHHGPSSKQLSVHGSSQIDAIVGAPIVETEDLVVRRPFQDDELLQPTTSSSSSSSRASRMVLDQKKFRKNKIIPSHTSRATHKEVEVKVEASMAEQMRENNLKNEEQRILQAFGEFFQGEDEKKKKNVTIQPTMKDFTTSNASSTSKRQRAAPPNNSKKKTTTATSSKGRRKTKRGYDSESSSSLGISTSDEDDFDVEDDDDENENEVELLTDDDEDQALTNGNNQRNKKDDSIEKILEEEDEADFNGSATRTNATSTRTTTITQQAPKRIRLVDDKPSVVQAITSSLKQSQQQQQKKNVKTVESISTGASSSPHAMTSKRKAAGPAQTSLNLKAKKRT